MILRLTINPDLNLLRFVKRRVDKILLVASADALSYVNTSLNSADVGTRVESVKRSVSHSLWLNGPEFLMQKGLDPQPSVSTVTVHGAGVGIDPLLNTGCRSLDRLVEISPDLYLLKKRAAYLAALNSFSLVKQKIHLFLNRI